jgi:hypothetical protein
LACHLRRQRLRLSIAVSSAVVLDIRARARAASDGELEHRSIFVFLCVRVVVLRTDQFDADPVITSS